MIAIGEAARLSGVSIETIRYYEREGIVGRPARAGSGRRLYSAAEIADLTFIRRCRDLGFPMSDARTLLALSHGQEQNCDRARDLASGHLAAVRARITELRRLEAALEELTGNCASGSPLCQLLDELRRSPNSP
jgi:MerR family mercuric resistance operon transcriptional regulator